MECLDDLRRQGFGILRAIIPLKDIDALRESISASVRAHTTKDLPQGYVGGLLRVNRDIAAHLANPRILEVCEQLFGPHFRISAITGTVNGPGVTQGDMHVDWPHNAQDESCIRGISPDTVVHLITFWMLTDFTVENGATLVVPGSHRSKSEPLESNDPMLLGDGAPCQLLGSAGDIGLLDARTWHAIAPNLSQTDRVAVIVRFAPWWLNLGPLHLGTPDRKSIVEAKQGRDPHVAWLPRAQFELLPESVQALVYSMVDASP